MRAKGVAGLVTSGILLGALALLQIQRLAGIGISGAAADSGEIDPADQIAVMPAGNDHPITAQVSDIDSLRVENLSHDQAIVDLRIPSGREPPARSGVEGLPARVRDWSRWHDRENLIEGGYSVERAEYLLSRAEELAEEFRRSSDGQQRDPARYQGLLADRYFALKDEIGDAEYERFLAARKRPAAVVIAGVYAGFAADEAGLRTGDEVFLYDNTRVFNAGQLEGLSQQKKDLDPTGPPVPASVRREGETILVMLPRGHLGFSAPIHAPVITDRLPPPPDRAENWDNPGARQ